MLIREVVFRDAPFGLAPPGLAVVAWVRRPWALAGGRRGWPGSSWTRRVMSTCSQRSGVAARAAQACWRVSRLSLRVVRRANLAACTGLAAGQRCQHRPPGGQPQRGPAAAPDHALALLLAAGVVRGHSPACPASARGWRTGPSPDSARKAALAAVSPPIEVATPVRPSLPEASLIAQAEQILPQAIHDARDQGLT